METAKKKSSGMLKSIKLNIKDVFDMDKELEFNDCISILVGKNGTGKTFALTMNFAFMFTTMAIVADKTINAAGMLQTVLKQCFDDMNFTGEVAFTLTSGAHLEAILDNGNVTKVTKSGFEDCTEFIHPVFMSSQMRLFSSMNMYLKMRKVKSETVSEKNLLMGAMLKDFKLYDAAYMETLIGRLPTKIPKPIATALAEMMEEEKVVEEFGVDLDKCEFWIKYEGSEDLVYMTRFGQGHQAIYNLILGQFAGV